jgi:hypothetical protein
VEGAQHAGLVAQHDDLLRADAERLESQRLREIGLAADQQPAFVPDRVEIALVGLRIPIGRRRQRRFGPGQAVVWIAVAGNGWQGWLPILAERSANTGLQELSIVAWLEGSFEVTDSQRRLRFWPGEQEPACKPLLGRQ